MNPASPLLRQVHPSFIKQGGTLSSQIFRSSPKDEGLVSVDNGERITAQASWARYTHQLGLSSLGICAVTYSECFERGLPVIEDGKPYPEHCSIDFRGESKGSARAKAASLRDCAEARGWLYRA